MHGNKDWQIEMKLGRNNGKMKERKRLSEREEEMLTLKFPENSTNCRLLCSSLFWRKQKNAVANLIIAYLSIKEIFNVLKIDPSFLHLNSYLKKCFCYITFLELWNMLKLWFISSSLTSWIICSLTLQQKLC